MSLLNIFREIFAPVETSEDFFDFDAISIRQMKNGRFRLLKGNEVLGTYARRRDAVRGAARRGFTVV